MAEQNIITVKDYKKSIDDLKNELLRLKLANEDTSKVVEELTKRQEILNSVTKAGKQQIEYAEGSYKALEKSMKENIKTAKEMAVVTEEDKRKFSELTKTISEQNEQLKRYDAEMGNHQRNVGNYGGDFKKAFTDILGDIKKGNINLGDMTKRLKSLGGETKTLGGNGGFGGIFNTIKNIGGNSGLGKVANGLSNAIKLGGKLSIVFTAILTAAKSISDTISGQIEKLKTSHTWQKAQYEMQKSINRANDSWNTYLDKTAGKWQGILTFVNDVKAGFLEISHGLGALLTGGLDGLRQLNEERKNAAAAREEYNKAEVAYQNAQLTNATEIAKIEREAAEIQEKATNGQYKTQKEIEDAQKRYNDLVSNRAKLLKDEADAYNKMLTAQSKLGPNSHEDNLALQQSKARLDEIEAERSNSLRQSTRFWERINKNAEDGSAKASNTIKKALKDTLDAQRKADEEAVKNAQSLIDDILLTDIQKLGKTQEETFKTIDIAWGIEQANAYESGKSIDEVNEKYNQLKERVQEYYDTQKKLLIEDNLLDEYGKKIDDVIFNLGQGEKEIDIKYNLTAAGQDGDLTPEQQIAKINEVFEANKQAIEQQISYTEVLLDNEALSADKRAEIERELAALKMELSDQTTRNYLDNVDAQVKAEESKKKKVQASVRSVSDSFSAFGNLIGTVAGIEQNRIEQQLENGKISEEEAKKEFERVKKMQIAEAVAATISGGIGAYMNDIKTYTPPFSYIMAGIDMASTLAAGYAQVKQIQSQTLNGGGGSGISSASGGGQSASLDMISVSPILDERQDTVAMTRLTDQTNQRVYILQSDITESNRQVEVRQSETTF